MCFRSPKSLCRVYQGCRHKLHFCGGCSSWVNKRCIGISGPLTPDLSFRCKRWTGQARPVDGRLMIQFTAGREKLDVVSSFCYLGDCLFSGVGCKLASITRCRVAWGKFNELLPYLTSRSFPVTPKWRVYNICTRSTKRNLGPNLILSASPVTQWPYYDPEDVRCHHQLNAAGDRGHGCSRKT